MVAVARPLTPLISEALARFGAALRDRFGARLSEVVLFGSRARGEAHEDSDVDVLVVVDDLSEAERLAVIDLASAIDFASPEWVGLSPLVYSSTQAARMRAGGRRLFRDIDHEGLRL
jgi:predicted nucleotidyltransferase